MADSPPETDRDARIPSFAAQTAATESKFPWIPVGIAASGILIALVVLAVAGRHSRPEAAFRGPELAPPAPYAAQLPITNLQMSEADSFAGNTATYIDGTLTNTGSQTITGAVVQVVFRDADNTMVQKEAVPLTRIRAREPYVDSVPLAKMPLKPGETADFRLVFDHVSAMWAQSLPQLTIVQTAAD